MTLLLCLPDRRTGVDLRDDIFHAASRAPVYFLQHDSVAVLRKVESLHHIMRFLLCVDSTFVSRACQICVTGKPRR